MFGRRVVMQGLTQEGERFKVLLMGIEEDTEEHREAFCRDVSRKYHLSFPLLRDVIERCPVVLRKNIPLKKAEALARALKQFGALVSIEGSKHGPSIRLEFQDLGPAVLALEDSRFRKRQNGVWSVTGKVKNISGADVADLWVLVQFFGSDGDLVTFEEVPLPINPLPPRSSSPFKVLFDETALVTNIAIVFKNAEGTPFPSLDERPMDGLTPEPSPEDDPVGFSASLGIQAGSGENRSEGDSHASPENFRPEVPSPSEEGFQGSCQEADATGPEETLATVQEMAVCESQVSGEPGGARSSDRDPPGFEQREAEVIEHLSPEGNASSIERTDERGGPGGASHLEEASQILGELSNRDHSSGPQEETGSTMKGALAGHVEQTILSVGEGLPGVPWIESFRHSVDTFYEHHLDLFQQWFRNRQKEKGFENDLHALMTILLHARFDQMTPSEKALENTEKMYRLVMRSSLASEDIPTLEGTVRIPADPWRILLQKALPRLWEVTQHVRAASAWVVSDLEQLLQVIPQMGPRTSRRASKWIRAMMAETVRIDFSQARVLIGNPLYRVAARLGIVDPQIDGCEDSDSQGNIKIQSFAKTAFPEDILRIEDPMEWVGNSTGEQGPCAPIHPRCEECLFDMFCPRLHANADPCEKGMIKAH
jgi:hypothetical protein